MYLTCYEWIMKWYLTIPWMVMSFYDKWYALLCILMIHVCAMCSIMHALGYDKMICSLCKFMIHACAVCPNMHALWYDKWYVHVVCYDSCMCCVPKKMHVLWYVKKHDMHERIRTMICMTCYFTLCMACTKGGLHKCPGVDGLRNGPR